MYMTKTYSYGGAPPLLAMNGQGYNTLIHVRVHNESSASAQSTRTSSMGGAPLLLAMNGRGYTVEGGGTWQLLKLWKDKEAQSLRALQVDRLQRRRDLADGCKGLSSGSPLPMGRLV